MAINNYFFSGKYEEYFSGNFNKDCSVYLMLANKLIHTLNPEAITNTGLYISVTELLSLI